MNLKKVAVILFVFFAGGIMDSCVEDCHYRYDCSYVGITVENINDTEAFFGVAHTNMIETNYGIRIEFQLDEINMHEARMFSPNVQLFQSAYADCYGTKLYKTEETVAVIRIFTQNDFDADHPAGSDVSRYFGLASDYKKPMEKYLAEYKDQTKNYNEEILDEVSLLLITAPTKGSVHKFKVRVILSDGRVLEHETIETEVI